MARVRQSAGQPRARRTGPAARAARCWRPAARERSSTRARATSASASSW